MTARLAGSRAIAGSNGTYRRAGPLLLLLAVASACDAFLTSRENRSPTTEIELQLLRAVEGRDVGLLRSLLDSGIDPNQVVNGRSLLSAAVATGDLPGITLLLDRGARPAASSPAASPLHQAVTANRADIVKLLLARGASPLALTGDCALPGDVAVDLGFDDLARLLPSRRRSVSTFVLDDFGTLWSHGYDVQGVIEARRRQRRRSSAAQTLRLRDPREVDIGEAGPATFNADRALDALRMVATHARRNPNRRFVVNLSWGSYRDVPAMVPALADLQSLNVIVVAAVGNDATTRPLYPAAHASTIAVGAVVRDANGRYVQADYSNRGDHVDVSAEDMVSLTAGQLKSAIDDAQRAVTRSRSVSEAQLLARALSLISGLQGTAAAADPQVVERQIEALLRGVPTGSPTRDLLEALQRLFKTHAGTSYTAPQVSDVIAMVLATNGLLRFDDVRTILATASRGGVLNEDEALRLARCHPPDPRHLGEAPLVAAERLPALAFEALVRSGVRDPELEEVEWFDFAGRGKPQEFFVRYTTIKDQLFERTGVALFSMASTAPRLLFREVAEESDESYADARHVEIGGATFFVVANRHGQAGYLTTRIFAYDAANPRLVHREEMSAGSIGGDLHRLVISGGEGAFELVYDGNEFRRLRLQDRATVPRPRQHTLEVLSDGDALRLLYDGRPLILRWSSDGRAASSASPLLLSLDGAVVVLTNHEGGFIKQTVSSPTAAVEFGPDSSIHPSKRGQFQISLRYSPVERTRAEQWYHVDFVVY